MEQYQVENFLSIIKYAIHEATSPELPALHEPVHWEALGKLAKAHNLFALFHEVACKYPEYKQSPEYGKHMQIALVMVAQQIKKTETFLKLYRAFLEADLHPIVMKGIICRQLYGKYGEHRPSGDEDILVRVEDFQKVRKVMEEHGFESSKPDVTEAQLMQLQDVGFYEKGSRFLIEVHTNIMGHANEMRKQMETPFKDVFNNVQTQEVKGVTLTIMSHTEHFIFLVLHAFKHFSGGGAGIRQTIDILLYQKQYEQEIDWELVKNVLGENHAINYLGDLQSIGVKYLGIELQVQLDDYSSDMLLMDIMDVGVFGKRTEADIIAARLNTTTAEKKSLGISELIRMAFPTREFLLSQAPYLEEKPWLLPVEWVKRWMRFFKRAKKYDGNLMKDSVKRSQSRKKLLKKYGL